MNRAFLTAISAAVIALAVPASANQAVSELNGSLTAGAGAFGRADVDFISGTVTAPLGDSFGAQIDATGGDLHHIGVRAAAAHLFWRDPDQALLGVYGDVVHFDIFGGLNAYKVGAEAEWYGMQDLTFSAVAGWEGGDTIDRGFDRADITYYASDDFSVGLGHRYTLGTNAGVLNLVWQFGGSDISIWGQGRLGEHATSGGFAGITWAIGGAGGSLRDRDRHDDPADGLMDTIGSGVGALDEKRPCDKEKVKRAAVHTEVCCECDQN